MGHGSIRPHLLSADLDEALAAWTSALLTGAASLPSRPSVPAAAFLRYLEFHGVAGLVAARLVDRADRGEVEPDAWASLRRAAARSVVKEVLVKDELGRVLSAAHDRGIHPLVLKGTALAYRVYPEPALRARNDVDLLIAPDRAEEMGALLEAHGYAADLAAGGHWASSERGYTKTIAGDLASRIDLHWRLNNSPLFWHPDLEFARLSDDAETLPSLHPHARVPRVPLLLVHACLHRASHARAPIRLDGVGYDAMNRLIWLYDMHLLSGVLDRDGWQHAVQAAGTIGIRQVCVAALTAASGRFGTSIPAEVLDQWRQPAAERARLHLEGSAGAVKLAEFRALPAPARWPWLREHLFPNAAYMRARFPDRPHAPLALLYLRRLVGRR